MAKLVGDAAGLTRRIFRKAAYIYTKGGDTVLAAWPRRPSGPPSPKLVAARDLMAQRSLAIKLMPFRLTDFSYRYSKHTMLMPRDWLFMGLSGRYLRVWLTPDKLEPEAFFLGAEGYPPSPPLPPDYNPEDSVGRLRPIYSMAALDDLTTLFDIYGEETGTIFYRTVQGWRGLAPGQPGHALTVQNDHSLAWSPAGGAGGGYESLVLGLNAPPAGTIASPYRPVWDTVYVDDFDGWSAADPTKITLPDDTLLYRLGFMGRFNASSTLGVIIGQPVEFGSWAEPVPANQLMYRHNGSSLSRQLFSSAAGFVPAPDNKVLAFQLERYSTSGIWSHDGPMFLTVEIRRIAED